MICTSCKKNIKAEDVFIRISIHHPLKLHEEDIPRLGMYGARSRRVKVLENYHNVCYKGVK